VTHTTIVNSLKSRGAGPESLASAPVLRYAALAFLAGFLAHNADHFRRGLSVLTPEVLWAGSVSGILTLAAIALTLRGHRHAPLVAVTVGFGMAIGVSIVHLLPRWSVLSDSLPDGNVDPVTWLAVACEIAGALAFGWAGARNLRSPSDQEARRARPAGL
jgi:hypothetical protein